MRLAGFRTFSRPAGPGGRLFFVVCVGIMSCGTMTASGRVQSAPSIARDELAAAGRKALELGGQLRRQQATRAAAIEQFEEAARLFKSAGDPSSEILALLNAGGVYSDLRDFQRARDRHITALEIARAAKLGDAEATTLNRLANLYDRIGDRDHAIEYYERALEASRARGHGSRQVMILINLSTSYEREGDLARALAVLREARDVAAAANDRRMEAEALKRLARVLATGGHYEDARSSLEEAIVIDRALGNRIGERATLVRRADLERIAGDPQEAARTLDTALAMAHERGDETGVLLTMAALAQVYSVLGDHERALDYLVQVRPLALDRHPTIEAAYHLARARVERARGNLPDAQASIESALHVIESERAGITTDDLRASHTSRAAAFYDVYIDVLMRRHEADPSRGYAAQALQASERVRARTLLELLGEAEVQIREGADPALVEREREIEARLNLSATRLMETQAGPRGEPEAAQIRREIMDLRSEYQDVRSRIRLASPRYASLTQPEPVTLREIQTALLDADTVLVEYALGDERSHLWVVSPTGIATFVLPPRKRIEESARRVHQLLARIGGMESTAADHAREYERAAAELSDLILKPAAGVLAERRLAIVADGALHYVPFGALPDPAAASQPLILAHEVVSLPSASVLAALRRERAHRSAPGSPAIVLADPVFERDDPRVAPRASESGRGAQFARLPFTRTEATAIGNALKGRARLVTDFDASRASVMSGELARYSIVHFATHGQVNTDHPELSGLILSLVDRGGRSQNGFLRLTDIFNLHLSADLVVLSGCQTGLGKELRGEGLLGLTRGFVYAGAARVMASLWRVDDRATAELMRRTYEGMLGSARLSPSAALRAAQMSLMEQSRWKSPYYWAAFVVQGDWR